MSLLERVGSSPAVESLAGVPRYDMYRHDVDTSTWIDMLDADFDNKQHLYKTALLIDCIAETDGSHIEDRRAAVLTGLVHDAPEAILGDINQNHKDASHEAEEIAVMGSITENGQLHLTARETQTVREVMADKASNEPQTEAGVLFDLGERIGYLLSALTAYDTAMSNPDVSYVQREKLCWLASNVLSNHYSVIHAYAAAGRQSARYVLAERATDFQSILTFVTAPTSIGLHARYYEDAALGHKIGSFNTNLVAAYALAHQPSSLA